MAGSGDEGLYSRQLYVLGGGARRLAGAVALVSGLRGTGAQVAAALVLAGTGRVVLHDRGAACTADRAHQFLLGESDVGQNRAEASQRVLAELNPRVVVAAHTGELSEAFLTSFQVVVLTESPLEEQLRIGDFCHARGICFIVADAKGLAGQLFCDFGEHFVVEDPAEGDPACATVQHISQGNPGVVTCVGADDSRGHLFCDGDLVTFSGVEGMTELNGQEPVPVHVLDAFRLEIGDTSSFSPYHRGGLVSQVRLPQVHSYEPLRRALAEPRIQVASPEELPRSRSLHAAFQALHAFREEQGRLPRPRALADTERVLELARSLGAQQGPLDEDVVRAFASVSAGDLCPVAAVVGALAAQEALKAITRKFPPLAQWLYFDALECLALEGAAQLTEEDCAPRGSRYDGQIAVFGAAFQEQLGRQKYLVVGAGAIGCELLKNFAMMGLAAGPGGDLTVTDMDTVALSNLHRQLLYRSADISKPKSVVAAAAVRRMNPSIKVTAHQNEVGPATEPLYGDNFFQHLDGVASALDTLEARAYLESRCLRYLTPLLDSGTEGPRGNVLAMVPSLTKPLGPAGAPRDGTFPPCTLRYFPRTIQHTLQWARDEFEGLFQLPAEEVNRFMEDPAFPRQLPVLEQVRDSLWERPQDWRDCVHWARRHWQSRYHDAIAQLLHTFPPEHETSPGVPFWAGARSCPHPLTFDPDNPVRGCQVLGWVCPHPPVRQGSAGDNRRVLCCRRRRRRGTSIFTLVQSGQPLAVWARGPPRLPGCSASAGHPPGVHPGCRPPLCPSAQGATMQRPGGHPDHPPQRGPAALRTPGEAPDPPHGGAGGGAGTCRPRAAGGAHPGPDAAETGADRECAGASATDGAHPLREGQQHPRGLHHGGVQPACRELWHPRCRLADEQADRWADRARHHHHHGGRGRAGVPGSLQAGVGVPGPQLLPQQQPLAVRLPAAPCPAPAAPHLPVRRAGVELLGPAGDAGSWRRRAGDDGAGGAGLAAEDTRLDRNHAPARPHRALRQGGRRRDADPAAGAEVIGEPRGCRGAMAAGAGAVLRVRGRGC